jgi:hypothetical protein
MSLTDIAGLIGVFVMLAVYAAASAGKLDPTKAPALIGNLVGPALVLYSLSHDFNLSAAILEGAWALVAIIGLVRLAIKRRP